jgi:hypothetical protein
VPLHAALGEEPGAPVRFVPQADLPPYAPYERFIFETRCVPTRENLHDFFNGLVWLRFPAAKRRLNELQAAQIAARGIGATRGPVRDAITVFDENGALLEAPDAIWDALAARRWRELFVDLRPLWAQARLVIFGHALLEQLVHARKGLTAHVWSARAAMNSIADRDRWLAAQLQPDVLAAKPFLALPVLGIPGWCAGNANFSFYDDSLVFRPTRQKNDTQQGGPGGS